jgi:DNA-nicking Smr family endonuclease
VKLDLNPVYQALKNYQGMGRTGEVIVARQDPISKKIALISPLRNDTAAAIQLRDPRDRAVAAFVPVFEGRNFSQKGEDYRGAKVLEVSRKIQNGNLALIAKIDLLKQPVIQAKLFLHSFMRVCVSLP